METPPDLVARFVFVAIAMIIVCLAIITYWAERSMRMCARLTDTIRSMGLAASNPLLAAKLEQQRQRLQAQSNPEAKTRGALLAEIASHQGAKANQRHAQNRAAHPSPKKPATMRYIAPDSDLLPDDDHDKDKQVTAPTGAPQ